MNGLAIVFCYFILFSQSRIQVLSTPEITTPPVSMSAFLDTWVSFHCGGEGEILVWQTNGELLTDEIKETRNITIHQDNNTTGILNSTLVIFAKPENDGLNIACIVGNYGSLVFDSAGADLFVKGIRPVEDLIFNISINESARVSWNPPSFVSNDVISLLYRVTITNDTDNIVIEYVTIEREYEVSIDILNLCSIYTVTVTAFDETYTTDSSAIQEEYAGEYSALIDGVYINVEDTGNFKVVFEVMLQDVTCNSTITGFTQINVPDSEDNHEMENNTETIEPEDSVFHYTVHNLTPQQNYIFVLQITDGLRNIKTKTNISFTTNHVQFLTANLEENGVLHVQCIFVNNSNASGCGLNFTEREDTTITLYSVQINKIQGSVEASGYIELPVSGNLTVIAFDILNDEVSDKAAVIYNGLAEIKLIMLSTTSTPTNSAITASNGITLYTTSTLSITGTHFSSSSFYYIQTSSVVYNEVSSIPKYTSVVSIVTVITIPIAIVIISIAIVIFVLVIIGLVKKIRRVRLNNGVCEDDINRNPAYEQVTLQRVVLSENQAYASIINGYDHSSTTRTYENIPYRL